MCIRQLGSSGRLARYGKEPLWQEFSFANTLLHEGLTPPSSLNTLMDLRMDNKSQNGFVPPGLHGWTKSLQKPSALSVF